MVRSDSVWQMSISQLPPIPLAQASAMLRAMAQPSASQIEARVVGPLPNGATQVQIGRHLMSLQLPAPQAPGTTLTLAVQQAEGQVRMSLISALAPPSATGFAPVAPSPATSVQLSAAALVGTAQAASPVGNPVAAPVQQGAVPAPASVGQANGVIVGGGIVAAASNGSMPPGSEGERAAAPAVPTNASQTASASVARTSVPYPIAVPALAAPLAAGAAGSATTALPPVSQPLASAGVGQHAAPHTGGVMASPPAAPTASVVANAPSGSPQVALTQMVQQALGRQDSVVSLTTALTQVVARVALPEPVMKAAQQVLGQRLSLDNGGPDGVTLQKAIRSSGIFQEAMLAGGLAKAAGGEMKSALLGLQRQLGAWLGDQAPVEQVRTIPPPLRGMIPRARADSLPLGDLPDDAQMAGKVLLERTDAALSRLRLHQNASLPEPISRHEAQWSLDLPVMLGGQQSLLHVQIHRDRDAEAQQNEDRGWQVRFAINLSDMGEVGAQISLRGKAAGILLWAERNETTEVLAEGVSILRNELEALGLNAGAIVVRNGAPSPPATTHASAGHIVDAVR